MQEAVTKARKEYNQLAEGIKPFDDLVRDVIAHTSIDSDVVEDLGVLKEAVRTTYLDEPEIFEILANVIDILSAGLVEELRLHRVYDETGALNYQFTRWLDQGCVILSPIRMINK